ncbi:FadR/GntR family transcriptional regulator [Leifsonia poae]|uniref:FadR/GntR family transcriptional regulator n=1 Tax=Leifsonia poae TaxID=110933 RepID=UPI001CC1C05D|nr:FCD domain-containing protein [Leifsonia poae]
MSTPTVRRSAVESVVADIEQSIAEGALAVGSRLGTRTDLAERYGVAPTTVAEVVRVLDAKGLVTTKTGPQGGIFVAHRSAHAVIGNGLLSLQSVETSALDCVRVIDALDPAIVAAATEFRSEADIDDLERLLDELRTNWADRIDGLRSNWRLHRRIAEIAPNPMLKVVYLNLLAYVEANEEPYARDAGIPPNSVVRLEIHEELVAAIIAGDAEAAARAVRRHQTVYDDYLVVDGR